MYNTIKLDNGLKIVSCNMPGGQSAALGIWISVGARYENKNNNGISHFLEHLLFKGSRHFSCRQIKESIEGVGGSLNGFTSEEFTCYLVKMPSRHLKPALEVLSDMVLNPSLPLAEIQKEKAVILEEIKMYKDQPQSYIYDLLDTLLWPDQELGMPIIGNEDSVGRLTRKDLLSFKEKHYLPQNIIISAAGDIDFKRLTTDVGAIFKSKNGTLEKSFQNAKIKQKAPQIKLFYKETEQTHMALGFHGLSRSHELRHALSILHIILGANMSSRLFNELREKRGLAYEIGTHLKRFNDTGVFLVHAGMDNDKIKDGVCLILRELEKIKKSKPGEREFTRSKEFYLGQLMLALEDTLDHMLWLGETFASFNRIYSLKDIIKEVEDVTIADISYVANQIFLEEKINLALIGPLKDKEESEIYSNLRLN